MELIKLLDRRPIGNNGNKIRFAVFKCAYCNTEVERQLQNGKRDLSCGCMRYNLTSASNTVHGDSKVDAEYHLLYGIWCGMRDRCYRETNQDYIYYGAKGIKLCEAWHTDYGEFKRWSLLNGYVKGNSLQIDRIDANLDYCPTNCRWVTPKVNQRNRDCVLLDENKANEIRTLFSHNLTDTEIASMYNVHPDTIGDIRRGKTWN